MSDQLGQPPTPNVGDPQQALGI